MREHVLSRKCWCRPKVVKPRHSWRKDAPRTALEWWINLHRKAK